MIHLADWGNGRLLDEKSSAAKPHSPAIMPSRISSSAGIHTIGRAYSMTR